MRCPIDRVAPPTPPLDLRVNNQLTMATEEDVMGNLALALAHDHDKHTIKMKKYFVYIQYGCVMKQSTGVWV